MTAGMFYLRMTNFEDELTRIRASIVAAPDDRVRRLSIREMEVVHKMAELKRQYQTDPTGTWTPERGVEYHG